MKKISLLFNLLLFAVLIFITNKERYISKLKQKVSPDTSLQYYQNRANYQDQISKYNIYNKQATIVMLGTSFTQDVDWNELLNRGDIINRGFGGDIFSVIASRVKYVTALHPKICFIEGGINDIDMNILLEKSKTSLLEIITALQKDSIIPILTTITFVTNNANNNIERNKKIAAFNIILKKIATENKLTIIDNNPTLAPDGYLKPEYAKFDGLHYLSNAYLIWKVAVEGVLKEKRL